ncbi:hypothetical protein N7468_005342 [Penicillium chermesinum]|uniref:Uncharacterized protein n=1 Tax=Penicillium chermesinum TaxID=63820 RepID=A0A9W9TMW5_9EURO|nr:uncharacterized protein N7468_005342 [Penicillium chermesinum]KAJ5232386.1 hypothetical protein N7468_005342 [Penicillium chermesinum]KAJ6172043.1 hypothetical protein N7470_001110 [Penicillium chermesinum]
MFSSKNPNIPFQEDIVWEKDLSLPIQRFSCLVDTIVEAPGQFVHGMWLFTYSDLKTIIATSFGFALLTSLGASAFGVNPAPAWAVCLQRVPVVVLWAWLNLLPFTIDNQRQDEAIMEDSINKPWRTMPRELMTPQDAQSVMFIFYTMALGTSSQIGGLFQCISLIVLGFWYNDAAGADVSCITRNLINGIGFMCYTSGALHVALNPYQWRQFIQEDGPGLPWLAMIGLMVFTTVQTQDLYDQAGDSARDRKTLPLVIGDANARWVTAALMLFWGVLTPSYWGWAQTGQGRVLFWGGSYMAALACIIAARTLTFRSVSADKKTFLLWNLWLVSNYGLPLCATLGTASGA